MAGPVQSSGSGFWPGLRVWPGRPGQFFIKKNQNDVVLVKKKQKSTGLSPGQPGHTGFFLPLFFRQPGPVPVPGRPGPGSTRRAGPGFKTMNNTLNNVQTTISQHQNHFRLQQ